MQENSMLSALPNEEKISSTIESMANPNEKEIDSYWEKVEKDVEAYNSNSKRRAKLSLTAGYKVFELGPETTLEECISVADNLMYDKKKAKKSI